MFRHGGSSRERKASATAPESRKDTEGTPPTAAHWAIAMAIATEISCAFYKVSHEQAHKLQQTCQWQNARCYYMQKQPRMIAPTMEANKFEAPPRKRTRPKYTRITPMASLMFFLKSLELRCRASESFRSHSHEARKPSSVRSPPEQTNRHVTS